MNRFAPLDFRVESGSSNVSEPPQSMSDMSTHIPYPPFHPGIPVNSRASGSAPIVMRGPNAEVVSAAQGQAMVQWAEPSRGDAQSTRRAPQSRITSTLSYSDKEAFPVIAERSLGSQPTRQSIDDESDRTEQPAEPIAASGPDSGLQNGLPMIPKPEPPPPLRQGFRSLYISVLRKSDHIRVHHRLEVRHDMTDKELFTLIRNGYNTHPLGFWRRWFTLKGLKSIQILECVDNKQPRPVELDDFVLHEIMFAYSNPTKITSEHDWVNWAFKLKQNNKRFALDFVEGWQGSRIITLGAVPWTISFLLAILWSARGGNLQTVFAVASFVLTAASSLLALLAIVSALES